MSTKFDFGDSTQFECKHLKKLKFVTKTKVIVAKTFVSTNKCFIHSQISLLSSKLIIIFSFRRSWLNNSTAYRKLLQI